MKKLLLILIIGIFLINLTSSEINLGTAKQGACITLYQSCPTCTYSDVRVLKYPNGTTINVDWEMIKNNSDYSFEYCNTSVLGEYLYIIYGNKGGLSYESSEEGKFIITSSGGGILDNMLRLIGEIVLLLTIAFLTIFFLKKHKNADFNSWDKNIIKDNKNIGQLFVNGFLYTLFKNYFIWAYFSGWLFVLVLNDVLFRFGSIEVYEYFEIISNIYSLGLILVGIFFIGMFVSYLKRSIGLLEDKNWGLDE